MSSYLLIRKSTAQTVGLVQQRSSRSSGICTALALRKRDVLESSPFSPTYLASPLHMVPGHSTRSAPDATLAVDEEGKNTGGVGHKGV